MWYKLYQLMGVLSGFLPNKVAVWLLDWTESKIKDTK